MFLLRDTKKVPRLVDAGRQTRLIGTDALNLPCLIPKGPRSLTKTVLKTPFRLFLSVDHPKRPMAVGKAVFEVTLTAELPGLVPHLGETFLYPMFIGDASMQLAIDEPVFRDPMHLRRMIWNPCCEPTIHEVHQCFALQLTLDPSRALSKWSVFVMAIAIAMDFPVAIRPLLQGSARRIVAVPCTGGSVVVKGTYGSALSIRMPCLTRALASAVHVMDNHLELFGAFKPHPLWSVQCAIREDGGLHNPCGVARLLRAIPVVRFQTCSMCIMEQLYPAILLP